MSSLKDILRKFLTPELSVIAIFVFMGSLAGNPPINLVSDVFSLLLMLLIGFYFGSHCVHHFFLKNRQDLKKEDRILAIIGLFFMMTPPFLGYMQGQGVFVSLFIMFAMVAGLHIGDSKIQKKIKSLPGLDVLFHGLTWGVLTLSAGTLYSGLETMTRGWLVVLLGFYLYASFFLMRELTSSKSLSERSSLIMYLGESKCLELIAILQLFGLVGLTTLYLSEHQTLAILNTTFYVFFTLFSLCGIFQTLVWSKNPTQKKIFNYRFYLIFFHLSLTSWVVAEWISLS